MEWLVPNIEVDKTIRIAKIEENDLDSLYDVYSDIEVLKYTDEEAFPGREYMYMFYKSVTKGYTSFEYCELKIEYQNKAIGTVSFHSINEEKRECEIGFLLARKYWGIGIMTKVLKALIWYLEHELRMVRIFADIESANKKAITIVNNIGFKNVEGTYYQIKLDA